jgi:hypothetical protein
MLRDIVMPLVDWWMGSHKMIRLRCGKCGQQRRYWTPEENVSSFVAVLLTVVPSLERELN